VVKASVLYTEDREFKPHSLYAHITQWIESTVSTRLVGGSSPSMGTDAIIDKTKG
jgi:hypothetical protein